MVDFFYPHYFTFRGILLFQFLNEEVLQVQASLDARNSANKNFGKASYKVVPPSDSEVGAFLNYNFILLVIGDISLVSMGFIIA